MDVFQHPNWSLEASGFPNDIALLRLSTAANVSSKYINPISMADPSSGNFAGQNCTIIGWGLFGTFSIIFLTAKPV